MSLNLSVSIAVCQDEFQSEMVKHLGLTYQQVEDQMYEIGFFRGNGDIVFDTRWPDEDSCNDVGRAMLAYMNDNGYQTIRVYEDH